MILQQQLSRRFFALLAVLALVFAAIAPLLTGNIANALELDQRNTVIDKAYVDATDVEYVFNFRIPTGGDTAVQGIKIQWCSGARQETCTAPTGTGFTVAAATIDAQNFPDDGGPSDTAFTDGGSADEGECNESTNAAYEICIERTDTDIVDTDTDLSLTISGITHPDTTQSIYPHMYLYDNATFTDNGGTEYDDAVHFGITAVAIVDQITVTATVAEYLEFCVGTEDADWADGTLDNVDGVETCSDFTDTSLNIGTVTFNTVCFTDDSEIPANENLCENADYRKAGYAMVSTNASDGVTISYIAEQDQTGGAAGELGTLRIPGEDCTVAPTNERGCFAAAGTTSIGFTAGTENFGMTVRDIVQNGDAGYNGQVGTANLSRDTAYNGDGNPLDTEGCADNGTTPDIDCWAWDDSGSPDVIASSTGVVDREHLVMSFAAAASLLTPTGTYSVTSTYIATPQF